MGLARTLSVALAGVSGRVIEVETDVSAGLPGLTFTGLPDASVLQARDRVRAAVLNSGFKWPDQRITVALLPADLRKNGSMFDLALAVSVLAAVGAIPIAPITGVVWLGELGLDGRLRAICGVLPAVLAARAAGVQRVVVPYGNSSEAALVTGIEVQAATSLAEIAQAISGDGAPLLKARPGADADDDAPPDLADVVGQSMARFALEVAAAGAHHLLFEGAAGAGKTMLAERLPSILPALDDAAALEVTAIHSVAGALPSSAGLKRRPPLQMPHHTASAASMVGGGVGMARPGAASLAHRGVLVLDEAAEFSPRTLDCLRQPLESGRIVLHRVNGTVEYPARFQLVLAMNPCQCGTASPLECSCSPNARRRYQRRLSGPLLDRIDLKMTVQPVARADLMADDRPAEPSLAVAARVLRARLAAHERWSGLGIATNAEVPGQVLRSRPWRPSGKHLIAVDRAVDRGELSARGVDRVLRLAWTVADLAGRTAPDETDVTEAVWLRTGREKESRS